MSERQTTKQKIDAILGIQDDQSVDDFLSELDINESSADQLSAQFDQLKDSVAADIEQLDTQINSLSSSSVNGPLLLKDMNSTMSEVEELIGISKKMFKHVYESICSSDLIDSELVASISKLLEGIHINIAEFIQLYKERSRFVDKIRLMIFTQQQKKELMELKHQQDLEKLKFKQSQDSIDATDESVIYSQDQVIKLLNENDNELSSDT